MAYNEDDTYRGRNNPLLGMIKATVGLSPLAVGAYFMRDKIRRSPSLAAVTPGSGAPPGGRLLGIAKATGVALAKSSRHDAAKTAERVKKFANQLLETDAIKNLSLAKNGIGEMRAIAQALLEAADDPTTGLDLKIQKGRLYDLLRDLDTNFAGFSIDEFQQTVQEMVSGLNSGTGSASLERLHRATRQYGRKGGLLRFPTPLPEPELGFDVVEHLDFMNHKGVSDRTKALYTELREGVSRHDAGWYVQIVNKKIAGEDQFHARVFTGRPGASRHVETLSLQTGFSGVKGSRPVFMGPTLHTLYQAPAVIFSDPAAIDKSYKSMTDLISAGMDYHTYHVRSFLDEIRTRRGAFDATDFTSRMREHLQLVKRKAYDFDINSNRLRPLALQRMRAAVGNNNLAIFTGLKGIDQDELAYKLGHLAARNPQVFSGYAPGYQMVNRTAKNRDVVGKLGLADLDVLGGMESAVPLDRSMVPPTMRIEQISNRDDSFFASNQRGPRIGRRDPFLAKGSPDKRYIAGPLTRYEVPKPWSAKHSGAKRGKRRPGSNLTAKTQVYVDEAIGFSRGVTGATNKAIIIDTRLDRRELEILRATTGAAIDQPLGIAHLAGEGVAFTARGRDIRDGRGKLLRRGHSDRIVVSGTKQVPNPEKSKYLGTSMYNEIIRRVDAARLEGRESAWFTKEEILRFGGEMLGIGSDGIQSIREDPNMFGMELTYKQGFASDDKPVVIFGYEYDKYQNAWKGWGGALKATVEVQNREDFLPKLTNVGYDEKALASLGIPLEHAILADASMFKKGVGPWVQAMQIGYKLVTGDSDTIGTLSKLAAVDHYGIGSAKGPSGTFVNQLAMLYGGTVKGLRQHYDKLAGINPKLDIQEMNKDIARVLHMVLHRGHGDFSYLDEQVRLTREQVLRPLAAEWGASRAEDILKLSWGEHGEGGAMAQLTGSAIVPGPSIADWGIARGSTEPRLLGMLTHGLITRGFSEDQAADAIASIFEARVGGAAPVIKSTYGLIRTLNTLHGRGNLNEAIDQLTGGLKMYTADDLKGDLLGKSVQDLARENPEGFYVDFTKFTEDTHKNRKIAAAAMKANDGNPIYFPGRDITDYFRETLIKVKTGESATNEPIEGRYAGRVKGFFEGVAGGSVSDDSIEKQFLSFKEDMGELLGDVLTSVGQSKTKGMAALYNRMIDLDRGATFSAVSNPHYQRVVNEIFERSRGTAVFVDSNGILSALNDWMGSGAGDEERVARQLHDFYMVGHKQKKVLRRGSVSDSDIRAAIDMKGAADIAGRHPFTGPHSFSQGTMYRYMDDLETVAEEDKAIFQFMRTKGWKIKDWGDLDRQAKRAGKKTHSEQLGYRMQFFREFTANLDSFAPEGGGSIYTPKATAMYSVTSGGKTVSHSNTVDLGIVVVSTGDWDGDTIQVMVTNKETGKRITQRMTPEQMEDFVANEARGRLRHEEYKVQAKKSIKAIAEKRGMVPLNFDSPERTAESLMSENLAKAKIGKISRKLDDARYGLLDLRFPDKAAEDARNEALELLSVIEEHTGIKGKNYPRYLDLIEGLANALDAQVGKSVKKDEGALEKFILENIFYKSYLAEGPGEFTTIGSDWAFHSRGAKGADIDLKRAIAIINQGMAHGASTGLTDLDSPGRVTRLLQGTPEEQARVFAHLHAGDVQHAAVVRGFMEETTGKPGAFGGEAEAALNKGMRAVRTFDHGLLGIGAAALGGALAVGGMINHQGYAPTPMVVPGEVMDPTLASRIGRGNLLNEPTPQQYEERASYTDINTPHHTPETYLSSPNAYNVRGTVRAANGLPGVVGYFNSLGGNVSGSVRINDTRLPISSSYVDRMMGEY